MPGPATPSGASGAVHSQRLSITSDCAVGHDNPVNSPAFKFVFVFMVLLLANPSLLPAALRISVVAAGAGRDPALTVVFVFISIAPSRRQLAYRSAISYFTSLYVGLGFHFSFSSTLPSAIGHLLRWAT